MALFNKNNQDYLFHPFIEFLIIAFSLIAILVPLRIFAKIIFVDEWIGSIGIITVVFGLILYLSKKEKLANRVVRLAASQRDVDAHHDRARKCRSNR